MQFFLRAILLSAPAPAGLNLRPHPQPRLPLLLPLLGLLLASWLQPALAHGAPSLAAPWQQAGLSGNVLACADRARWQAVASDARTAPAVRQRLPGQLTALAIACEVAGDIGARQDAVFVPQRQRRQTAHFVLQDSQGAWFGKAKLDLAPGASWPEAEAARLAAELNFGPAVREPPAPQANVLLVALLPAPVLTRRLASSPKVQAALLGRLHAIHAAHGERPASGDVPAVGAAASRLEEARRLGLADTEVLASARARLLWLEGELQARPVALAYCHGDPAITNTVLIGDQLLHIDWEAAHWGDPLRDVARLVSDTEWPHYDLPRIFALYAGREGEPAEIEHLSLLVAGFDLDHWAARLAMLGPQHPSTEAARLRIGAPLAALPALPPVVQVNEVSQGSPGTPASSGPQAEVGAAL